MARQNPFGDYSTVDLSSIYNASQGPGSGSVPSDAGSTGGQPAGGQPAGAQPGPNGSMVGPQGGPAAAGGPVSPLYNNPQATAADTQAYWSQVAGDLIAGKYDPNAIAGRASGAFGPGSDGSPENNLPGMAYAGTQLYGSMTPEQAAMIQYNTPAYQQWLINRVAGGGGDNINNTRTLMQQAYQGSFVNADPSHQQTFAGNPADEMAATQVARQADYQQFASRLRASGASYIPSQADYERGMGLTPIDPNAAVNSGYGFRGTGATDALGHATNPVPTSAAAQAAINPGAYDTAVDTSFKNKGMTPVPVSQNGPVQQSAGGETIPVATATNPNAPKATQPDYAKLAATDRQYAANLAKTDPKQAAVYTQRAADYESRITQPSGSKVSV